MTAVDRAPGTRSIVVDGKIVTGMVSDPTSVKVGSESVANALQQDKQAGLAVSSSDTMSTVVPGAVANGTSLLLEVSYRADTEPATAGVTVQSLDPKAGWSAGRFYPTRPLR